MKTPEGRGNKFAAILQARQSGLPPDDGATPVPAAVIPPLPGPQSHPAPTTPAAVAPGRTGRVPGKGKSSDPSFRQVTAYIPQGLHNDATIALRLANQVRVDNEKEDFSELLTRLLAAWYERQTFYRPDR